MDLITSNKITGSLIKIFWITVGWTLVALLQIFIGYSTILDTKFQCDLVGLDLMLYLKSTLVAGLLVGMIDGSVVVFVWEKWLGLKATVEP